MSNIVPIDEEFYFDDDRVLIIQTDLDGNITYANSKFRDVSGYTLEELLGKNHNIIRHPDMPDAVFKKMWDTIKDGQVYNGIIKNLRKDGSYFWVDLEIMPIKDDDKNIIGYISAARSASKQDIEENQALYQKMLEDER